MLEPDFEAAVKTAAGQPIMWTRCANNKAEAGLVMHQAPGVGLPEKGGFHNVMDLGRWWKNTYGLPLPLGANVLRRDLAPAEWQRGHYAAYARSIEYALDHREEALTAARSMSAIWIRPG